MDNWSLTFPLGNYPLPGTQADPEKYRDWSIPELLAGRRFAQSTLTAPPAPMSSSGVDAEPRSAAPLPSWLDDAQWR